MKTQDAISQDGITKEPVRVAYTREEMIDLARIWLRENYPVEKTAKSVKKRMIHFGLMVDFITDHFPKANNQGEAQPPQKI